MSDSERAARYREQQHRAGYEYIGLWVPKEAAPDFRLAAELVRTRPSLTLGPLRDVASGKLVSLKGENNG